jgi:serine/threonine protein kinase
MLLDEKMRIKLADFGTAKLLSPNGSVENVSAGE